MKPFGIVLSFILLFGAGAYAQLAQGSGGSASVPQATMLPSSGRNNQGGSVGVTQQPVPGTTTSVNTINTIVSVSGPYSGSAAKPTETFSGRLSLDQALHRGLAYNLGTVGLANTVRQTSAQVGAARSALLPNLNGAVSETLEQVNLAAMGFRFNFNFPGVSIPKVVGPFNYMDLQVSLSQTVANLTAVDNYRAAKATARAGQYSLADARDLVVLAVGGAYLQTLAAEARLDAAQSQLATANAVFQQSIQQHEHGVLGRLNLDQSQVRALTQQQQIITLRNDLAKQKINLARLVGLPPNAGYELSDHFEFSPAPVSDVETAVALAESRRADLKSAQAQVEAAQKALAAARAQRLPSLGVTADYEYIGATPSQASGAYTVAGTLNVPIWQGGRIEADIAQAKSVLAQRQAELADTRSQIEAQVRQAYLDLEAAAGQVEVAQKNLQLAHETLEMARARMEAGVINTVEVVQAQETVSSANLDLINSIFAHNLAKLNLARATGDAAAQLPALLKPQPATQP
ncbi:MAG TPA: TolC family protein [Bryobacteraceae bacterium]|nr:TolC family protein [Bryobacteraceae bacterium]